MRNRFALLVACAALFLNTTTSNAQERNSKSLVPTPDPMFSPELSTLRQVKGKLLIAALDDIESSRQAERQTAAAARKEASRLLAFDWSLQFVTDAKGTLAPGSSRYEHEPIRGSDEEAASPNRMRIPKGVVLLAIKFQQSSADSIDSGQGGGHAGINQHELDLICGPDWIITWLEDENGNMIEGTAELYCGGQSFPLPLD